MKEYPLTSSQLSIFAEIAKNKSLTEFNQSVVCNFPKSIDANRLVKASETIYKERPELHLRFFLKEGRPMQVVDDNRVFTVKRLALSESEAVAYIQKISAIPMDIQNDILFKVIVIETPNHVKYFVQMHHIIGDGTTFATLFANRDLALAYEGKPLPVSKCQILWKAEQESVEKDSLTFEDARKYFMRCFQNATATHITKSNVNKIGILKRYSGYISKDLLQQWISEKDIDASDLFLTALSYMVGSFTYSNDLTISILSHGRSNSLRKAYGMFVNVVPLRVFLDGDITIIQFTSNLKNKILEHLQNRIYPYTEFSRELNIRPSISYSYQGRNIVDGFEIEGKFYESTFLDKGLSSSSLNVLVYELNDKYEIRLETNEEQYTPEYSKTILKTLINIVNDIISNNRKKIKDIKLIENDTLESLRTLGYGGYKHIDEKNTVVHRIIHQATLRPKALAISDDNSEITYRELNQQTDVIAQVLLTEGLLSGEFVCILLDRTKNFPLAVFATMKAGGAYIPIDTSYPINRIRYIINDSCCRFILTSHRTFLQIFGETTENVSCEVLFIEDLLAAYKGEFISNTINHSRPEGAAYMIYTSGSTGNPKGAIVKHSNLTNFTEAAVDMFSLTKFDRISGHRSFAFDAHIEDMFPILTVGGSFHIMPEKIRHDIYAIRNFVEKHRITGGGYSTAFATIIINRFPDFPVRYISGGGEKMNGVYNDHIDIFNVYGPTECTDDTNFFKIPRGQKLSEIPIGRPIHNSWNFIVNQFHQLQPRGVQGELCIVGQPVGAGYWNDESLTALSFSICPFIKDIGQNVKMYFTGDICQWNEDNNLLFVRRIDEQINLHGYRIDTSEIENAILSVRDILSAFVCLQNVRNNHQICAYFTALKPIDINDLKSHLLGILPKYMLPSAFFQMKEIPLTVNGKVMREALPLPSPTLSSPKSVYKTKRQELLTKVFAEVLGIEEEICLDDSFVMLGGDSIKAIHMTANLHEYGYNISVSDILTYQTPRLLSEKLTEIITEASPNYEPFNGFIKNTPIIDYYLNSENDQPYNQVMFLQTDYHFTEENIRQFIDILLSHHDMLRASFVGNGFIVRNDVSSKEILTVRYLEQYEEIVKDATESQRKKWGKGETLFAAIYYPNVSNNSSSYLLFIASHLIIDSISWNVLLNDTNQLFDAMRLGRAVTLPKEANSYFDYSKSLDEYVKSSMFRDDVFYWENLVYNSVKVENETNTQKYALIKASIPIDRGILCGKQIQSLKILDILIASASQSYCKVFSAKKVCFFIEGHGRNHIACKDLSLGRTIGWFTSLYPLIITDLEFKNSDLNIIRKLRQDMEDRGTTYLLYLSRCCNKVSQRVVPIKLNYLIGFSSSRETSWNIVRSYSMEDSALEQMGGILNIDVVNNNKTLDVVFSYEIHSCSRTLAHTFLDDMKSRVESLLIHVSTVSQKSSKTYALSPIQEGMLYKCLNNPPTAAYRLYIAYKTPHKFKKEDLFKAFKWLTDRHEALRTNILYRKGGKYQQVVNEENNSFSFIGMIPIDDTTRFTIRYALDKIVKEENGHLLDLEHDSLFKVFAFHTPTDETVVLFCIHHIVTDAWSTSIIVKDFFNFIYRGCCRKEEIPSVSYEKHIKDLANLDTTEGLNYWKELLKGYHNIAAISTYGDVNADSVEDEYSFEMSHEIYVQLKRTAQNNRVTMSNLIELVWGSVLQKFCNLKDVVFAKVVSGRDKSSFDCRTTVGPFINTIPVRMQTDGNESVAEILQNLNRQALNSGQWDFCSLQDIQSLSPLGSKLIQSTLVFDNIDDISNSGGQDATPVYYRSAAYSPLSLLIYTFDEKLHVCIKFDTKKYSLRLITSISSAIQNGLQSLVGIDAQNTFSISLVDKRTKDELLSIGEGMKMEIANGDTIIRQFVSESKKHKKRKAIIAENGYLTYEQLNNCTNFLAAQILESYEVPSRSVLVLLDRILEFPVATIGIMKAGYAYIPIDPDYPSDKVETIIVDASSSLLITTQNLYSNRIKEIVLRQKLKVIFIDLFCEIHKSSSCLSDIDFSLPEGMAYIIYTSGTTGKPKGVMISHAGLVNFIDAAIDIEQLKDTDRISAHRSFSFDAHIIDLYPILIKGGELFIMPSSIRRDLTAIHKYIIENRITGCGFTTPITCMLLNTYPEMDIRFITGGGDRMKGVYSDHIQIINLCGPTECTDDYTSYTIEPGQRIVNIPIGRPVANMHVFLVDSNGNLAPFGAIGEICVAGVQVGLGYWHNEKETNKHFVKCPFLPDEVVMYYTGDYGRWNIDQQLMFVGRNDSQYKLNGYRIEAGEIESYILRFPGIKEACVKVQDSKMLCAYYVQSSPIVEKDLIDYLKNVMPEYEIPELFMQLESIPLTENGKTDYARLPIIKSSKCPYVEPKTNEECLIYNIVSHILNVENIGMEDNLASFGMSSIDAMKIAVALLKEGYELSPRLILKSQTIKSIIDNLDRKRAEELSDGQNWNFLSDNQLAIYIEWEKNPDLVQYNTPVIIKITNISAKELQPLIAVLLKMHPILNSTIVKIEGECRIVHLDKKLKIPVLYDHSDLYSSTFKKFVRPFNLLGQPLSRFYIVENNADTWLFMDVHHIIFDGVSRYVFMRDLCLLLEGKKIQYEDTAYKRKIEANKFKGTKKYLGIEIENIGFMYPSYRKHLEYGNEIGTTSITMPISCVGHYCRNVGVTPSLFFLSSFIYTLHVSTRFRSFALAVITAGRHNVKELDSIGMFVEVCPVISNLNDYLLEGDFESFMRYILEEQNKEHEHFGNTFFQLAKDSTIKPEIMYAFEEWNHDKKVINRINGVESTVSLCAIPIAVAKASLILTVSENSNQYELRFDYKKCLYDEFEISALLKALSIVCQKACSQSLLLRDITLCSSNHINLLLEWGRGDKYELVPQTFVEKFMIMARTKRNDIAVVDDHYRYTYGEIERMANLLAKKILDTDVTQSPFVAVISERSADIVLATLAVMKTGYAYVPIETEIPLERIKIILRDTRTKVIITSSGYSSFLRDHFPNLHIICLDIKALSRYKGNVMPINKSVWNGKAYMIYTSGSTGIPKGVVISHSALTSFTEFVIKKWRIDDSSCIACYSSFCFDASVEELFPVLTAGGIACIIPKFCIKDMSALYNFITRHGVNGVCLPTQFGQMFINTFNPTLRFISLGGEEMTTVPNTKTRIINAYGPTEFTVIATYHELDMTRVYDKIPIGRPIDNACTYILDENLSLVPAGIPGELCLAGNQISEGYWNNKTATKQRFVLNPYARSKNEEFLYRTGDICRWNEQGELDFLGRDDFQIKMRGYRIEVGEIEHAILKYSGVNSVCVVVKRYPYPHTCAYYVSSTLVDADTLIKHLKAILPDYMIPSYFERMEALPLTISGKIDRRYLIAKEDDTHLNYCPPETNVEKLLCRLMAEVLDYSLYGVNDDFVVCGGDSIRILLLQKRFNESNKKGIVLDFKTIYEQRTPRKIARKLNERKIFNETKSNERLPLSEMQQMHFQTCMQHPREPKYNIPILFKLDEGINIEKLAVAIKVALENHKVFYTRIKKTEEGGIYQTYEKDTIQAIPVVKLDDRAFRIAAKQLICPFALLDEKLYRIKIFSTPSYNYLFLDIHHLIFDAVSETIFFRDIERAYQNKPLIKETLSFDDIVKEEISYQQTTEHLQMIEWYSRHLKFAPKRIFPIPDKKGTSGVSDNIEACVCEDLEACMTVVEDLQISLNSFLTAAFGLLLANENNIKCVPLVLAYNGRNDSRTDHTIGVLAYPVFVACDLINNTSRREIFRSVHNDILKGMSGCYVSMKSLKLQDIGLRDYMQFLYDGEIDSSDITIDGKRLYPIHLQNKISSSGLPMTAHVYTKKNKIFLRLRYSKDLYSVSRLEEIVSKYRNIINRNIK